MEEVEGVHHQVVAGNNKLVVVKVEEVGAVPHQVNLHGQALAVVAVVG